MFCSFLIGLCLASVGLCLLSVCGCVCVMLFSVCLIFMCAFCCGLFVCCLHVKNVVKHNSSNIVHYNTLVTGESRE